MLLLLLWCQSTSAGSAKHVEKLGNDLFLKVLPHLCYVMSADLDRDAAFINPEFQFD